MIGSGLTASSFTVFAETPFTDPRPAFHPPMHSPHTPRPVRAFSAHEHAPRVIGHMSHPGLTQQEYLPCALNSFFASARSDLASFKSFCAAVGLVFFLPPSCADAQK